MKHNSCKLNIFKVSHKSAVFEINKKYLSFNAQQHHKLKRLKAQVKKEHRTDHLRAVNT